MPVQKCVVTIPNRFGGETHYEVEAESTMAAIAKVINSDRRNPPSPKAVITVRWDLRDLLNDDPRLKRIVKHRADSVHRWMAKRGMTVLAEKRAPD